MEIEKETSDDYAKKINIDLGNIKSNNFFDGPNLPYNGQCHNFQFVFRNLNCQNPFNGKKYARKRTYNESINNHERIKIKENELKYLLNFLNKAKINPDKNNNFLFNSKFNNNTILKGKESNIKDMDNDKSNDNIKIDYSIIDLNDVILQLYQSNKISDELKNFLLKKLINNAIEVEKTFNNYFNFNKFPNKK